MFAKSGTRAEVDPAGKETAAREECMGQDPVSMETKEILKEELRMGKGDERVRRRGGECIGMFFGAA